MVVATVANPVFKTTIVVRKCLGVWIVKRLLEVCKPPPTQFVPDRVANEPDAVGRHAINIGDEMRTEPDHYGIYRCHRFLLSCYDTNYGDSWPMSIRTGPASPSYSGATHRGWGSTHITPPQSHAGEGAGAPRGVSPTPKIDYVPMSPAGTTTHVRGMSIGR